MLVAPLPCDDERGLFARLSLQRVDTAHASCGIFAVEERLELRYHAQGHISFSVLYGRVIACHISELDRH